MKTWEQIESTFNRRSSCIVNWCVLCFFYACHLCFIVITLHKKAELHLLVPAHSYTFLPFLDPLLDMNFWKRLGEKVCLLHSGMDQRWLPGWRQVLAITQKCVLHLQTASVCLSLQILKETFTVSSRPPVCCATSTTQVLTLDGVNQRLELKNVRHNYTVG